MDEGKLPSSSYQYPSLDNKFFNQQMNYPSQNYIVGQSYSNNLYYTPNPACMESKNCFPNLNELCYWDDKSTKSETESYATKDQSQFYPFNTRDKPMNKQIRKPHNQWDSLGTKCDIPSCSEERNDNLDAILNEAMMNKFNFQKENRRQKYSFENNFCLEENNVRETKCDISYMNNYYEYCDDYTGLSNYLGLTTNTSNVLSLDTLDHQTEVSNDESDIVVEETDDEIMDLNEELMKNSCNRCVICNLEYTHHIHFYHLTSATPITMTSQQPVLSKLKRLIGPIITVNNQICSGCLGILNSIDHLQTKLNNLKNQLQSKFAATSKMKGQKWIRSRKVLTKYPNYRCKYCRKILSFKTYCQYHINQHNRKLLCDKCGVTCATVKKFHRHICIGTNIPESPIIHSICSNCTKTFKTKTQLKEHQNYCLGILPYICEISSCGKRFATATRLKNHTKLKHEKKFVAICSICNIGFVKLSDYKAHKITHSTDKKFQCQKCPKSYKTLSNLNFHLKSHQKTLPFMCDICNKGFMRKDYLETHLNNHKGIKNFACSICAKKFTCQKNLDSHFKYHDGSIKKKVCNICGKYLTTSLNEHLRIHTNLREFECNECDLKFNTKGTLLKHKRIKHAKMK